MDLYQSDVSIGDEGRRVRETFKKLKRSQKHTQAKEKLSRRGGPAPPSVAAIPSPEHYHLTYEYDGKEIPDFRRAYPRQRPAYLEIAKMAEASSPNVEYYDDGRVLIETRLHGRTGKYRVLVGVAACLSARCTARLRSPLILPVGVRA
jgi:hypothetical protein